MKLSTTIIGVNDQIVRSYNYFLYDPPMCIKIDGIPWYRWDIIDTINEESITREIFLKR